MVLELAHLRLEVFAELGVGRRIDPHGTAEFLRKLLFALADPRLELAAQRFGHLGTFLQILRKELSYLTDQLAYLPAVFGQRNERSFDRFQARKIGLALRQAHVRVRSFEQALTNPSPRARVVRFDPCLRIQVGRIA